MSRLTLATAGCALCLACMPSMTQKMRSGAIFAPNPKGCPITFLYQNELNMAEFDSLGSVMLQENSFTDAAKQKMAPTACEWGGDTVTIQSAISTNAGGFSNEMTMFAVLRKRDASAPRAELACIGRYVNTDGASLSFNPDSTASMNFGGYNAVCQVVALPGGKADVVCSGARVTGVFAGDCSAVDYNGVSFKKAP